MSLFSVIADLLASLARKPAPGPVAAPAPTSVPVVPIGATPRSYGGNRKAFLDMLAFSEGTSTSPATRNNGYDVVVTGVDGKPEIFTDYTSHPFSPDYPANMGRKRPSKVINSKGLTSNAAGRYQHMLRDWPHYRDQLGLKDFGPESQDAWAIQLIRERRALSLIDAGKFDDAAHAVSNLWASLPGANYADQHMNDIAKLRAAYIAAGGIIA